MLPPVGEPEPVNVYRAYLLDNDGKIAKAPTVLECDNDKRAIQLAKQMLDGSDIEVWQGSRLVMTLQHEKK